MKASKTQAVHIKCKHEVAEKVERKQQEEPEPEKNKSITDNNSA